MIQGTGLLSVGDITGAQMLRFLKKVYSCEVKNPKGEIGLLSKGWYSPSVYMVCLERNGAFLSIINTASMKAQYHHHEEDYTVAGISSTYRGALSVVKRMTEDCLKDTGNADVRDYILKLDTEGR
ncbi:MAG: hypothetical protein K6E33_03395 [Lachnospiraceae bacterium]|nr:hypothetical protein [Lachnospiraceae bacterium]